MTRALNRSSYILSPKLGSSPYGSGIYIGVPPHPPGFWDRKKQQCMEWTFSLFYFFFFFTMPWWECPQLDLGVVHRSIGRTCSYAFDTWGRDGLGSSGNVKWSVPGICCTGTGNGLDQCRCSMGEFEIARGVGIRTIRRLHTWHNTWWRIGLRDTDSTCTNRNRQLPWYIHRTWVHYNEGTMVVVDCTDWLIFHQGWILRILALLIVRLAHSLWEVLLWRLWGEACPTSCHTLFLGLLGLLSFGTFETWILGQGPVPDLSHVFHGW